MPPEEVLSNNDIYVSSPIIEIDGRRHEMLQSLLCGMEMLESEQGLSSLELRFFNTATVEGQGNDFAFEYSDNDSLSLGKSIKVYTGDHNDPREIFRGLISGLEMVIGQNRQPVINVLAEDALQKARLARRTLLYAEGPLNSIVQAVASNLGLSAQVDGLNQQVDAQLQLNESDLAFLRRLLLRFDGELQIVGDTLQVSSRSAIRRNDVTLEFGSQLLEIRLLADLTNQVSQITFAGWDAAAGQEIQVQSGAGVTLNPGQGKTGAQVIQDAFGERSEHLSHVGAQNDNEAQALVNAVYARRARKFVCAEGLAVGNPSIRVGTHLAIQGVGPRFENTYYVTEARHRYDTSRGYQTAFKAECAYFGG